MIRALAAPGTPATPPQAAPPPPPATVQPVPASKPARPLGVTILAVLYIIQAILWFAGSVMMGMFLGPILAFLPVLGACVYITIIFGVIYLLVGIGLFTLKKWARILAIIFAIIGLLNLPIGTIISIIILWYLFRADVKAAFT
ncbi:MAG: hypothetical protein QW379_06105 [Thermoplasmata archaeon]